VTFDPSAQCNSFLNFFLKHILDPEDIDLLQRYCSQILLGLNYSQTILILTGESGWGKSSLMKILGSVIGWNRVGIIREQLFTNELELAHYQNKKLLYHPDMPTDFLDRPEASMFKQLVGGDPLWADVRGDGRITLEGHFPVILACIGKPRIHLDSDLDAWMRRLVVLHFRKPVHETHFGKMAELIMKEETSGIVNWLLEGLAKLWKDKLQLILNQEQKQRAANLLVLSESSKAFITAQVQKVKGNILWPDELYEHYQAWCRNQSLRPLTSYDFMKVARDEIEIGFGRRVRRNLPDENGSMQRGWMDLAVVMDTAADKYPGK
jgi:phage/plasmid-associated DNA primase